MTKPWDSVREEVTTLYLEGKPLSQVKRLVEEKRRFRAS